MANPSDPAGPWEVWRGAAPVADGRQGLSAHLDIALEGMAGLAAELGLNAPYSAHALARLRLRRAEIRIAGPARAGETLYGTAELAEARVFGMSVRLVHCRAADDARLAEILLDVDHVSARTLAAFPWPRRVARRIAAPAAEGEAAPERARPGAPSGEVRARGVFAPQTADAAGQARAAEILARMAGAAGAGAGGACAFTLHAAPQPGWPFVILADPEDSTGTVWMADAASGAALASAVFEAGE